MVGRLCRLPSTEILAARFSQIQTPPSAHTVSRGSEPGDINYYPESINAGNEQPVIRNFNYVDLGCTFQIGT